MSVKKVMVCNTCNKPIWSQYSVAYLVDEKGKEITSETEDHTFNNLFCMTCFTEIDSLENDAHVAEIETYD